MKQKRNMYSRVAMCLAIIMLICSAITVFAASNSRSFDELTSDQKLAVDASEALTQYFAKNGWITEYPTYFGGSYIENNLLIIRLASPTEETLDTLKEVLQDYAEVVIYEYCDISNAAAQTYADNTAKELIDHGCGVTHWYVDSVTGNVVIGIVREDIMSATQIVEELQNNSQGIFSPKIILEIGEYSNMEAATVYGGTRITCGSHYSG